MAQSVLTQFYTPKRQLRSSASSTKMPFERSIKRIKIEIDTDDEKQSAAKLNFDLSWPLNDQPTSSTKRKLKQGKLADLNFAQISKLCVDNNDAKEEKENDETPLPILSSIDPRVKQQQEETTPNKSVNSPKFLRLDRTIKIKNNDDAHQRQQQQQQSTPSNLAPFVEQPSTESTLTKRVPLVPAYQRFQNLVDKESSTTLLLPSKYRQLLEQCKHADFSICHIHNQQGISTFTKLKELVQQKTKKILNWTHLDE